ncbi:MAG: LuxR C-terminal-related transcriptional regulator [Firmicutes bacterium]|nr:LuxR C-terminal-related transcriptional regulator [Bacillota bacterium]
MKRFKQFLDEILETKDLNQIEPFVKKNVVHFFDSPYLTKYYKSLKPFALKSNESKLVLAWLAFLSGDFMSHYMHVMSIHFDELEDVMKALYLDLKSISKLFGTLEERYKYSLESLQYVENDNSFYKGNALAIHANLIFLKGEIRKAAEYFEKAFEIFFREQLYFQASVAISNSLTDYMRLGEFSKVIEKAQHILMLTSEFQSDDKVYWEVLGLPMGSVYMITNKPALAMEWLNRAERAIDQMELVHMHGSLEIYLIKTYLLLKDFKKLGNFLDKTCHLFEHMHIESMQTVIGYGKIVSNHPEKSVEIERMEQIFLDRDNVRPLVMETIAYLSNHQLSNINFVEKMVQLMDGYRYSGDIVSLQTCLLQLAEHYYIQNDYVAAKLLIEEAIELYHQKNVKAPFYLYDYHCFPLISKIDKRIITTAKVVDYTNLLTQRELEILALINQGKNNDEIGKTIFISEGTVKWHINHILSKLEVKNRLQAIDKAKTLKLLD